MKIFSMCNSCSQSYELLIVPATVGLIDQIKDDEGVTCLCPRLCGGRINIVNIPELNTSSRTAPLAITAKELYQAVNGLGLPDEIPNDPIVVDALLRSGRITKTSVEPYEKAILLHEITLDSGVTLHLASASGGARVLKITKERPCQPESSQKP